MKDSLSGLELNYLLKELEFLAGSRLDNIYQPDEKTFIFQFYAGSKGKQLLKFTGRYFHLVSDKGEMPEQPSGFCQNLRKHLESARLIALTQKGFERILELEFETKTEKYNLILELFSGGNLILCAGDYRIVSLLTKLETKDRLLKHGGKYTFPKKGLDLYADIHQLTQLLSNHDKEVVKILAQGLGIGGKIAEELCLMTGIDKNKKMISGTEIGKLHNAMHDLLDRQFDPVVVFEDGKPTDALPFKLEIYKDKTHEKAESFNAALAKVFAEQVPEKKKKPSRYESEINRLQVIIDAQSKQQKQASEEAVKLQKLGENIYENYQDVKELIETAKKKEKDNRIKKTAVHKITVEL